jgi:hypothetical protein
MIPTTTTRATRIMPSTKYSIRTDDENENNLPSQHLQPLTSQQQQQQRWCQNEQQRPPHNNDDDVFNNENTMQDVFRRIPL